MATKLSDVEAVQVGDDKIPLKVVIQGYSSQWQGLLQDADGDPVSLAGSQLTCRVEFMTAEITVTRSRLAATASATNFKVMSTPPARSLMVEPAADQAADPGRFTMTIPADLYPGEIEPDADMLPIAVGYLKRVAGMETRLERFILAFRRGEPTP